MGKEPGRLKNKVLFPGVHSVDVKKAIGTRLNFG
jgi:hypothetical protein